MTLKELANGLTIFIEKHPEFADKEVYHSVECGYSTAGFESPLTIAVPTMSEEFQDEANDIYIVSDDDGYRTTRWIIDWKFYGNEN